MVDDDKAVDAHLKGDRGIFMVPRAAKSLLRVRRWGIKRITGEEREEESESRERNAESARAAAHARACAASCWSNWSGWSGCSTPCGNTGKQQRTRQIAPPANCAAWVSQNGCQGSSVEEQDCGRSCHNGGALRATDCACPPGFTGRCCENSECCAAIG